MPAIEGNEATVWIDQYVREEGRKAWSGGRRIAALDEETRKGSAGVGQSLENTDL